VIDGCATEHAFESAKELFSDCPNLSIIRPQYCSGFGEALGFGFQAAIDRGYDPVITMDGDLSHCANYIKELCKASQEYDLVIASRYIEGVRVEGWKFRRLLISKLTNMFISYIMVKPIWDFTSKYRCYRKAFLSHIDLNRLHSSAHLCQIQLLHLAFHNRFRVKEIPFIYRCDPGSPPKMENSPKWKTVLHFLKFRAPVLEILRHLTSLQKDYQRFVEEHDELVNPPKLKTCCKPQEKDLHSISVAVIAHNEEKIIGRCLEGLITQILLTGSIDEIIVVSSGSTDSTNQIVKEYEKKDNRIKLITQPSRLGKASAINEFLKIARGEIAIIESADTVTQSNTVEELIKPFESDDVAMTGAHPSPVNPDNNFIDFCVHKLWQLHHHMALDCPKCGEMVAFRNIVAKIPIFTAVDEAALESLFCREGYKLAYAANAIVYNKGPETIRDFILQRRRIASGHQFLKATMGHKVATDNLKKVIRCVWRCHRWSIEETLYMLLLIGIEGYARFLGIVDYYLRDKNPFIWDIATSTKKMT
jgi:glycosyltransferase involved in cell wall biosynthesis